jgi:hypothetical protein
MDGADVGRILADAGLRAAEPFARRHVQTAYRLTATPAPEALGATRLGGTPDLPPGVAWPADGTGRPGVFLGQLDLADLAVRAPLDGFPASGLLSLFVTGFAAAGDPLGMAAVLSPAGAPLVRHRPLDDPAGYADPDRGLLAPIGLELQARLSLPTTSPVWEHEIAAVLSDDEAAELAELFEPDEDVIGQLGGYGTPFDDGDHRRTLYFHRIGRGGLQYADYAFPDRAEVDAWLARVRAGGDAAIAERSAARLPDVEWILEHEAEIEAEADRLRLLIRVDSNREMGLLINDADAIYVYLPAEDLARGDVSRVEAMVTQG